MPIPAAARGTASDAITPVSVNAIGPARLKHRQPFCERTPGGTRPASQTTVSSPGERTMAWNDARAAQSGTGASSASWETASAHGSTVRASVRAGRGT
jgi:hypothetical protein